MNGPLAYDPEDAYFGPLGEISKRYREQIPMNLLPFHAMLHTVYSSLAGRRAMIQYCRDEHFGNLFTLVVGDTGCGKGTCWNIVREIAKEIDPSCISRIAVDVASTPGLIGLVRDASSRVERGRVIQDPGVKDKRMLVVFEEMENLVTSIERKGSTLDKVMNAAWDGKTLENNGRLREKATDPHLSFICQITPDAFRSIVGSMRRGQGCSNGFFNRFITVAAKKERSLPRGGDMPNTADLTAQLRASLNALGPADRAEPVPVQWHESTFTAWEDLCEAIDGDHPLLNQLGGMRARLKPNIMRTAARNALSVCSNEIMLPHLIAAKSFVLQSAFSSLCLYSQYGSSANPRLKHRVLRAAKPEAQSSTEFHRCLHGKGYKADELHSVIEELVAEGQLTKSTTVSKDGDLLPAWKLNATEIAPASPMEEQKGVEPVPAGTVIVEGIRLQQGAPLTIRHDANALEFSGSVTGVRRGQEGHLAAISPYASEAAQREAQTRLAKQPNHVCVIIEDRVLFAPRKAVEINSPAAIPA